MNPLNFTLFILLNFHLFCFSQNTLSKEIYTFQIKNSLQKNIYFASLDDPLEISFDDLNNNTRYKYRITHCDIYWNKSSLTNSQFINGSNDIYINTFETSYGTLTNYTHYSFNLPNAQTKINRTGNYIISILDEHQKEVYQRKIVLYKNQTSANFQITESIYSNFINQKQRILLKITPLQLTSNYPKEEFKTIIYKNHDFNLHSPWLNARFINNQDFFYDNPLELEFEGGNEFLYFDHHEINRTTDKIATYQKLNGTYYHFLFPTPARNNTPYTYNPDINGNYVIRSNYNHDTNLEADYSWITFTLTPNETLPNDFTYYVYGAFNNYECNFKNELHYNASEKNYSNAILLKQGFYNYQFIAIKNGSYNETLLNGSHFETENDYTAVVYYKPNNSMFYDVVGVHESNSKQFIK